MGYFSSSDIKVSDRGGGIHPLHKQDVWRCGYTTVRNGDRHAVPGFSDAPAGEGAPEEGGVGGGGGGGGNIMSRDARKKKQVAGYGFGLPLSIRR